MPSLSRSLADRPLLRLFVAGAVFACAETCRAVTITYVGTEPGTAGSGFATANWSNAGVAKLYATGTSNTYGKDGYWQIRPMPWDPGSNEISGEPAGSSNNLGTSAATFPTLWSGSLPSFIGGLVGYSGSYVNYPGYAIYRGPDGSSLYRQGGLSVSVNTGTFNTPSGNNTGLFGATIAMNLTYSGTVRVGFAVDSVGAGAYAPDYVGIFSSSTGTVFSSLLSRDGSPDMAVFDIANPAGEQFIVAQWQLAGTQSISVMSLATFDLIPVAVPEPSTVALLAAGGIALACRARRRPRDAGGPAEVRDGPSRA